MLCGVNIAPEIFTEFEQMKIRGKYYALFLRMAEGTTTTTISRSIARDSDQGRILADLLKEGRYADYHAALMAELHPETPCYAVIDFRYCDASGIEQSKIVFVKWICGSAPVRERMTYAVASGEVKRALPGLAKEYTSADVDYDSILSIFAH